MGQNVKMAQIFKLHRVDIHVTSAKESSSHFQRKTKLSLEKYYRPLAKIGSSPLFVATDSLDCAYKISLNEKRRKVAARPLFAACDVNTERVRPHEWVAAARKCIQSTFTFAFVQTTTTTTSSIFCDATVVWMKDRHTDGCSTPAPETESVAFIQKQKQHANTTSSKMFHWVRRHRWERMGLRAQCMFRLRTRFANKVKRMYCNVWTARSAHVFADNSHMWHIPVLLLVLRAFFFCRFSCFICLFFHFNVDVDANCGSNGSPVGGHHGKWQACGGCHWPHTIAR